MHTWEPSSHGWFVGAWVGCRVGDEVVGESVGNGVGWIEGCAVGVPVPKQLVLLVGSITKPSKQMHSCFDPKVRQAVDTESQPWEPLLQGCSVGMCVGDPVGESDVGGSVGSVDGFTVGLSVGAPVAMQPVVLCGSVTKPSRHAHL